MTAHIDDILLGTASSIQTVAALPTTNVENFQQGTLFKLPSGQVFRLTKPIFKATPLITDFELLVTSGKTPLPASDIVEVNGDTYFDTTGLVANTELLVVCLADGTLELDNTRVKNKRPGDSLSVATTGGGAGTTYNTGLKLVAGEVFYFIYKSPTESYYEKLRDPNLAEAALKYWAEYWVSNEKGLSTNHGKSIEVPYQTVADFTSGWIDFGSRVNIMSGYDHAGGWTLADQNYITFEGAGKTSMMYGGIEITGLCEHITFRNLNIANDITLGSQGAIKFTDIRGKHVIDNLWTDGNTAPYYLEFDVNCFNGTADGITTFGALACTIRNSDLTGSTGVIKLNGLGAGQYAYIKLENSQVSGIEVGTGWYVLHDADSVTPTVTYTGTASSANMILTTAQSGGGGGTEPVNPGGVITNSGGTVTEVFPTAAGQVLRSTADYFGTVNGSSFQTVTFFPDLSPQISGMSGTNLSSMMKKFDAALGNYQSYSVWIDIWESGSGSTLMSRKVYMEIDLRMDLIAGSGIVDINEFIVADRQRGTQKGTLSMVYNGAGYGGAGVEVRYEISSTPYTNLYGNIRILQHSIG